MLSRFTKIDYDREMAIIATTETPQGEEQEIGVGRYIINPDGKSCEFAVVVADAWQRRGIGYKLLSCLIEIARNKGLRTMEGSVLASNAGMVELVRALDFEVRPHPEDAALKYVVRNL